MKKTLFVLILISLSLPSTLFAQEEVSCSVENYSQTLKENGSVEFLYSISSGGEASHLALGGLPGGVTGVFSEGNKIILSALQGAQLGSFDISVLYGVQEGNSLNQTVCSFNIVVEPASDRDITQEYIPIPLHNQQAPAVVEKGKITTTLQSPPGSADEENTTSYIEGNFVSPLYVGIQSKEVKELQSVLKQKGYFPSWVEATGYYGEITVRAVADFQAANGIDSVGFVGPLTRAALNNL